MTIGDPLRLISKSLGGYRVEEFLNSGAFGFVYRATRPGVSGSVALKILKPDAGAKQILEFENEGTLLFKLSGCGSVVEIVDSAEETMMVSAGGGARFAVRLRFHVLVIADASLDELLVNVSALDWPSRLSLIRNVALGVHQMHHRGIVHRDIKAANALLYMTSTGVEARVADLGRSRDLQDSPAASPREYEVGRGDPDFGAPELLWGIGKDQPAAHRCVDLYGIGSLIFELTIGHGITAVALFPQLGAIVAHRGLPVVRRAEAFQARLPETRSWFEPAFELFEQAVPPCIRPHLGDLVRQLCDPDPIKRLPQIRPGRRASRPDDLNWLLRRLDIVRLTLRNDMRQQERLTSRKETRA